MHLQKRSKENCTKCVRSPHLTVVRVGSELNQKRGGRTMLSKDVDFLQEGVR